MVSIRRTNSRKPGQCWGDGGVQSRAQNEEAPGIWPQEEAPKGRRAEGPAGKQAWPGSLSPSSRLLTLSVLSGRWTTHVRCLAHSRLLSAQ